MSLNPVQFGKDVIDQFGRYLLTTFPVADERLSQQIRDRLKHNIDGDPLLYKGPYVYLNRPFKPGPQMADLIAEGRLHPVMKSVFPYPALHYHQAEALEAIQDGHHLVLSTGTGSGKTEAFMLPIIDHCLQLRDENAPAGVVAVLVYPMNALVNDQLDRLRWSLAGTGVTFGRYTGETAREFPETTYRMNAPVNYTSTQSTMHKSGEANFGSENLPIPWEECFDQATIRNEKPRILLTNYAQLEYLMLRDKDLHLLRDAPLRFIVFDEVHTYTGALGSEVACLVRRLRDVARKSSDEVTMIGTSATVSDDPDDESGIDTEALTRRFAHRLLGVPEDNIAVVRETYRDFDHGDTYQPPLPNDMLELLDTILDAARTLQLQSDVADNDVPHELVNTTAYLCGREPNQNNSGMEQLAELLVSNHCVARLREMFIEPLTWEDAIPKWRNLGGGRHGVADDVLIAEILAYLTLGALVVVDGDPLLRPKLHYFVQGLQGLGIVFSAKTDPEILFSETEEVPPLLLCRSCGQHYTRLIVGNWEASNDSRYAYRLGKIPAAFEEPYEDKSWLYLTDQFYTQEEDDDDHGRWNHVYVCSYCHAVHEKNEPQCLDPRCKASDPLVPLLSYLPDGEAGIPKKCGACNGPNSEKTRLISYTRSAGVADVTILAQSMLTMMTEPSLRKVLIFADSRQDAAFQAGWMDQRAKRFRLRHIIYQIARANDHPIGWDNFVTELIARAQQTGILLRRDFDDRNQQTQMRWFLIEEFAFVTQRRSNLEQLGLVGVVYGELDNTNDPFFTSWAERLNIQPEGVLACVRLMLDMPRRRGMLSDGALSHWWSDQDPDVFQGRISVPDFYRPNAMVLENLSRSKMLKGWLAKNGRSAIQVAMQKAIGDVGSKSRDDFLKAAWKWLVDNQYLTPVTLTQRRRGQQQPLTGLPENVYQVNVGRVGLVQVSDTRYVCTHCHTAQQVMTPSRQCPEYRCKGQLEDTDLDSEHFDVFQYVEHEFVPMSAREHSAQVPQDKRLEAERQFKSETGFVNTIVATPTLEMGVDIGKLEMVMMRNVPPTPANYAQRSGRAGRRHRIGAVFTYAGGSQHDRYFYRDPPELISGAVRVPAFSMQNEPLIRKHVHSTVLTALREWTSPDERDVLAVTFPTFINDYLAEWHYDGERNRPHFFTEAPRFPNFSQLITTHRSRLLERLVLLFNRDWPEDDREAVIQERLSQYLDEMPKQMEQHVRQLFNQVKAYRGGLSELRRIEERNQGLRADEKKLRQRLERARDNYLEKSIGNYTLSWLAVDGFFPGYALSRESVLATCIQPLVELSRPASIALREITPSNWVYVDGKIFGVRRLNFGKLRAEDSRFTSDVLREEMYYESSAGRIYSVSGASQEGGDANVRKVVSYQLTDVEMEQVQSIDDRREARRRIPFNIVGTLLDQHHGGDFGRVGDKQYRHLQREVIRLVNLGPVRVGPVGVEGFPLCPACGETRSPSSTQVEIDHFRELHRETCSVADTPFVALHVEFVSDVLCIGPYETSEEAVNAYEGLLAGAREFLDMGGSELDGFFYPDSTGAIWSVLYDPLPGGTGFLDQLLRYWDKICKRGAEVLSKCDCETACYKCLRHFRNQQHHKVLDRHSAMAMLAQSSGGIYKHHAIAPIIQQHVTDDADGKTESPAEEKFLARLEQHGFSRPPVAQQQVDLGNANYTVADFAWPEKRILVFIDGTSAHLHGDPERAKRDRNKRRQANMKGWHVVVITAQELDDEQGLAYRLEDISFYLDQ
jgi:very-short-patch-repair endonuclease